VAGNSFDRRKVSAVATSQALPRWLPSANRLVRLLTRLGPRLGTVHVLTVPGRGELAHGRRRQAVTLEEVTDPDVCRDVMRAFPREVPHGVPMFVKLGLVTAGDPDEFAAAAGRVAVFRIRAS
jgi:hypothetical protein